MTTTTITEKNQSATSRVELLVLMVDESGGGRDWDQALQRTRKARCPAKQLGRQLGHRAVHTFENHSELTVTVPESEEIQDGDLIVAPFMERAIDAGLDCALRVVARGQPYDAGGEVLINGVPIGDEGQVSWGIAPSPPVGVAPRGRYVTLKVVAGTVDAADVEEVWDGELRLKAGRDRWIPRRFRPENADRFMGTARALGFDAEAARAGKAGPRPA